MLSCGNRNTLFAIKVFFFVDKDDECTTKDRIIEKLKRNAEKIERQLEEVNHDISRSQKDCEKLQTKNELYEKELMNLVEENETLLQDKKNLQNELEVCSQLTDFYILRLITSLCALWRQFQELYFKLIFTSSGKLYYQHKKVLRKRLVL